jgi:serine/threonine protein kinase
MAVVPRIGTEFAGYRIEALLGRGGMSVVYRAENTRLGNKVALKLLAEELALDESFRERFVRESRTAAGLNHPNIVPIYDAGDWEGVLYIAMRWVDGDLKAHLKKIGPLAPDHALTIAARIGSALDAAHARGLLHRDVKPANILLEPGEPGAEPIVYLADFGLTKHLESRSGITASGQFVGTIDYMSPEQIEGRDVDARTDVYSLGCVLFECLVGTTPFRRETEVAVLWAHMREEPPPLSDVRPDLPRELDGVLAKAMAKHPDARYASCRDLVTDLRHLLATAAVETYAERTVDDVMSRAGPTSATKTVVQSVQRGSDRARRRRWLVPALAVLALLLAGAAGAFAGAIADDPAPQTRTTTTRIAARPPPPEEPARSPAERLLLLNVPPSIRETCRPTEPPTPDFVASVVCRPGGDIIKVEYSRPESAARNNRYFDKRVRAEQGPTPVSLSSAVNCHTPPPLREWRIVRTAGHRPGPHTIGGRGGYQGRFICYQSNWWAAIEWTDARVDVYSIAYGPDIGRLFRWWKRNSGPIRTG